MIGWLVRLRRVTGPILSAVLAAGCVNIAGGPWTGHEVSRATSPDGRLDAVVVEGSAGATTGVSLRVFVVAKGTKFNQQTAAFEKEKAFLIADSVKDLKLAWTGPSFLEIAYSKATIFSFSNFGSVDDGSGSRFTYEVRLMPQDSESSLIPPGTANRSQKNL